VWERRSCVDTLVEDLLAGGMGDVYLDTHLTKTTVLPRLADLLVQVEQMASEVRGTLEGSMPWGLVRD
jgi:hypothetical protein